MSAIEIRFPPFCDSFCALAPEKVSAPVLSSNFCEFVRGSHLILPLRLRRKTLKMLDKNANLARAVATNSVLTTALYCALSTLESIETFDIANYSVTSTAYATCSRNVPPSLTQG
jgi:hypothetical protein